MNDAWIISEMWHQLKIKFHQSWCKRNFRGAQAETQEQRNREEHSYYIKRDMMKRQRRNKTM